MRYVLTDGVWFAQPHTVIRGVPDKANVIVYDANSTDNGKASRWHYISVYKNEVCAPVMWDNTRIRIRTVSEVWEFEVHNLETVSL